MSGRCFSFFKHTQIIYAGYVKVTPGEPQNKNFRWELNFHLVKRKKSTESGFNGAVTKGCYKYVKIQQNVTVA